MKTLNLDARDVESILDEVKKLVEHEEYLLANCGHTNTSSAYRHYKSRLNLVEKIYGLLRERLKID